MYSSMLKYNLRKAHYIFHRLYLQRNRPQNKHWWFCRATPLPMFGTVRLLITVRFSFEIKSLKLINIVLPLIPFSSIFFIPQSSSPHPHHHHSTFLSHLPLPSLPSPLPSSSSSFGPSTARAPNRLYRTNQLQITIKPKASHPCSCKHRPREIYLLPWCSLMEKNKFISSRKPHRGLDNLLKQIKLLGCLIKIWLGLMSVGMDLRLDAKYFTS